MKIISKYKDYYDYYAGIFGIDSTKVYDRKQMILSKDQIFNANDSSPTYVYFAIGGKEFRIIYFKGNMYHTAKEVKSLDLILNNKVPLFHWIRKLNYDSDFKSSNNKDISVNKDYRQPIMLKIGTHSKYIIGKTPHLKSFGFHKIMDAKQVYLSVETFLGWLKDNPPLIDKRNNKEKILSNGFDILESFRNIK